MRRGYSGPARAIHLQLSRIAWSQVDVTHLTIAATLCVAAVDARSTSRMSSRMRSVTCPRILAGAQRQHLQSVWTPLAQRPTSPWASVRTFRRGQVQLWDGGRENLLICGGDIGDEGDKVSIFSVNTGLWSRGSLPSQITSTGGVGHRDGVMNASLSGESSDNVVFVDDVDRMAVIGVSRTRYLG